jgi:hypothetical protein
MFAKQKNSNVEVKRKCILISTGWRRETGKFEIIRKKKRRKLTKFYLILKMCSTRVQISLGIIF